MEIIFAMILVSVTALRSAGVRSFQTEMRSVVIVIANVLSQKPRQVSLAEHSHVVKQIAPA